MVKWITEKCHSYDSECLNDAIRKWLERKYDYKKHGCPNWKMLVKAVIGISINIASEIANGHKGILPIITLQNAKVVCMISNQVLMFAWQ